MNVRSWSVAVLVGLLALAAAPGGAATKTKLVSLSDVETQSEDGDCRAPAISNNARWVAFTSTADDLDTQDSDTVNDVYLRDLTDGQTFLVSKRTSGAVGELSSEPSISSSGRFVAFASADDTLVPDDTNNHADTFIYDHETGQVERVSVKSNGDEVAGGSTLNEPAVSGFGRYVTFSSNANDLVANDTNSSSDVFVHDQVTGRTRRVSVRNIGGQANGASDYPSISDDGTKVVFQSTADDLVADDDNDQSDVFMRDIEAGTTTRVSVASDESEGDSSSEYPTVSGNGKFVAFQSLASDLVNKDANGEYDAFVRDLGAGKTSMASLRSDGKQLSGYSYAGGVSNDGRYVLFSTQAQNIGGNNQGDYETFLRDRVAKVTQHVSVDVNEEDSAANSGVWRYSLTNDGKTATFMAPDVFAPGDDNGEVDCFVRAPLH